MSLSSSLLPDDESRSTSLPGQGGFVPNETFSAEAELNHLLQWDAFSIASFAMESAVFRTENLVHPSWHALEYGYVVEALPNRSMPNS